MTFDEGEEQRERWYSARCVFCQERPGQSNLYEERVILINAGSEEQAIRIAEEEAEAYVADNNEGWFYTGFLDLFHLFDASVGHKIEVFSLMRTSDLKVRDYLDRYFDTGSEHGRS